MGDHVTRDPAVRGCRPWDGDSRDGEPSGYGLGATVHGPATEVGEGIVTATVRTPQGSITGFIVNPHVAAG